MFDDTTSRNRERPNGTRVVCDVCGFAGRLGVDVSPTLARRDERFVALTRCRNRARCDDRKLAPVRG